MSCEIDGDGPPELRKPNFHAFGSCEAKYGQWGMVESEKRLACAAADAAAVTPLQPRWLRPAEAARYCGLSRARLYAEISSGRLRTHRVGGCRLIDRAVLDAFIEARADESPNNHNNAPAPRR